jgi:hypothetical protein
LALTEALVGEDLARACFSRHCLQADDTDAAAECCVQLHGTVLTCMMSKGGYEAITASHKVKKRGYTFNEAPRQIQHVSSCCWSV